MKTSFFVLIFSLVICRVSAQEKTVATAAHNYNESASFDSSVFYPDTVIHWMSLEEAQAAQKKNPKKIYIYFYATWCKWCRMTDSVVFRNREIAHFINQHYYAVKFNAENRTPVSFRGKNYVFLKDENIFAHELTVYLLNNHLSYPGSAFLDEQGNSINARNGYMEPAYFEVVLNYYAGNAYKTVSFYNYEFDFEGKVLE